MLKNQTIDLKVIEKVALALGEINDEVIYVGGAVVSLCVTDKGAEQPRPTKDYLLPYVLFSFVHKYTMFTLHEQETNVNI